MSRLRTTLPLMLIACMTSTLCCHVPHDAAAPRADLLENAMSETAPRSDREIILAHIRGIFRAYLRRDREAIRSSHTADWMGFQGPSTQIERGIEAYMRNADSSLDSFHGTGYELLDTEVQIYGELAIVYYVARYDYRDADGNEGSIPLRSVDIYRRDGGDWNQAGSHITVIPTGGIWGDTSEASTSEQ